MRYDGEFDRPGLGTSPDDIYAIDLWRRRPASRSRIATEVLGYWEKLREGTTLPRRSDLDPSDLRAALPFTFLLERTGRGIARIRVCGQHISDLLGQNARGLPISVFCASGTKEKFLHHLDEVFDRPASLAMDLVAREGGSPLKTAEMLILPLLSANGRVERALGCIASSGPIEFPPYRFDVRSNRLTQLPSPVPTETEPKRPCNLQRETGAVWKTTPVPWLKIVK